MYTRLCTFACIPFVALTIAIGGCANAPQQPRADAGVDPNYDAARARAVRLTQTQRGAELAIDARVLFDTGKFDVKAEGQVMLDNVASLVKQKSAANLLVEGHTDNVGAAAINQRLSEQRAESVRAGLLARGVQPGRIQTKGLGMTQPVADNASEDGRAQNRRVQIVLLGETVEQLGGQKATEERLQSGLEKFIQNAEALMRGVWGKITGGDTK